MRREGRAGQRRTGRVRRGLLAGVALAGAAALMGVGGCASDPSRGYSFESTYDQGVRSVAVPVFDNYSFELGVDAELTEAVIKEIQRSTHWVVVGSSNADTTVTGVITDVRLETLSLTPGVGLVGEQGVRITIDFDWRDNRTGKLLASKRGLSTMEAFVPARGTGEPLQIGRSAAAQAMAREVVRSMRSGW